MTDDNNDNYNKITVSSLLKTKTNKQQQQQQNYTNKL